jgi:hypothetical protein
VDDTDEFLGASIAIENNIVVLVGAPYDDSTGGISSAGSVYVVPTAPDPPKKIPK